VEQAVLVVKAALEVLQAVLQELLDKLVLLVNHGILLTQRVVEVVLVVLVQEMPVLVELERSVNHMQAQVVVEVEQLVVMEELRQMLQA
jgi:hypothetical protein